MDLWVTEESEQTGSLLGYIEVYDFKGVGMPQVMSGSLRAKVEPIMRPKTFYSGFCERVYIINASVVFSAFWAVFRAFLSPGAEGIVVVDRGVPAELLAELGGADAAERLDAVLRAPAR